MNKFIILIILMISPLAMAKTPREIEVDAIEQHLAVLETKFIKKYPCTRIKASYAIINLYLDFLESRKQKIELRDAEFEAIFKLVHDQNTGCQKAK